MTTALEQIYKSKNIHKLVCIKHKNGSIERIKEDKVYNLIKNGSATYCSKSEYKAFMNTGKKEAKEVKTEIVSDKQEVEKPKRKKKEIRADNKKENSYGENAFT